jgi:CRISPR system Cascade subunit CasC
MDPRFVQVHFLTAYPGALLNRDDAGFAKRLPFGGATRTRVSSQCLKRHWRTFEGPGALAELGAADTVRSRVTFQREVVEPLIAEGLPSAQVHAAAEALKARVFGQSKKAEEKAKGKAKEAQAPIVDVKTEQVTVLGRPELLYFQSIVREALAAGGDVSKAVDAALGADAKKNLNAAVKAMAGGLGSALFGRMVTSDILSRGDAAVHVAHAFTVHAEQSETDYFSAIDDLLKEDGELGSGHIGNTELTSGLYYGYVVIDVPLLVSNITGCDRKVWDKADRALAAGVVERLIQLICTVSPGAKLGSTAPYSYAQALIVEVGARQPRTLANAFLSPVPTRGDVLASSLGALSDHVSGLDKMYGREDARLAVGLGLDPTTLNAEDGGNVAALAAKVGAWVRGEA